MKTFSPKPRDIDRKWYVVDAEGAVLGRLAAHVATILRGKHKPIFAPHADTGDHVVVINARGIRLTGNKTESKMYYRHSGYPGGLRTMSFSRLMTLHPTRAVELAVKGMLPKNRLGREIFRKLSVYEGSEHPHEPQQPVSLNLGEFPRWEGLPKVEPPAASATPSERRPPAKPRSTRETGPGPATGRGRTTTRAGTPAKSTARSTTARAGGGRATAKTAPAEGKTTARRPAVRRAAERVTARRTRRAGEKSESGTRRAAKSSATGRAKSTAKTDTTKTRGRTKKES